MKRRVALKQIAFATGFVVATPTVLSLLNSCSTPVDQWTPMILSPEEGRLLTKLVDVFLPKTDNLPSATELNVPEFIDRYVNEIYSKKDSQKFKEAYTEMNERLLEHAEVEFNQLEELQIKNFLNEFLKVKGEEDEERLENPDFNGMTTSEILNSLKSLSIKAYITTEKIGEEILAYDPIPGAYYCADLNELTGGKSWSLD